MYIISVIIITLCIGYQKKYDEVQEKLKSQGIQIEFIKGSKITEKDLDAMADPQGGQTLIIIDDSSVSTAASNEMAHLFTMARHKNCSMVLLLHFIFGPWPSSRIISANTGYYFMLSSPRMKHQVATLGSQIGLRKTLLETYDRETSKPYRYVLVDLCVGTPEEMRIRNHVIKCDDWHPDCTEPVVESDSGESDLDESESEESDLEEFKYKESELSEDNKTSSDESTSTKRIVRKRKRYQHKREKRSVF